MKQGEIPKIIHFSVPNNMTEEQKRAIEIAKNIHKDWEIRVWDDRSRIPGAYLTHYLKKANSGAQRADLWRYDIIYKYGGIYLDSDMYVRRKLDDLLKIKNKLVVCPEDGNNLNISFFAAPPQHDAIKCVIDYLLKNEPDWTLPPNITTGPKMFSSLMRFRKDIYVLPRESFYPYLYNEKRPDDKDIHPCCFAVHEWAASWVDKENILKRSKKMIKIKLKRIKNVFNTKNNSIANYTDKDGDIVTAIMGKVILHLSPQDKSLTPHLALTGKFEKELQDFIWRNLKGGDFFIDVGANIGLHTMIAAKKCGPFGRVYAIEPNKDLVRLIEKSSLANYFHDRIITIDKAASARTETLAFEINDIRTGDSQVKDLKNKENMGRKIEATSLDELIPINIPVKMLKIDVEGWEHKVIEGAKRLIKNKCFDFIIVEVSREIHKENFKLLLDAIEYIISQGYSPNVIKKGRLKKLKNWIRQIPPIGHVNLILKRN